MNPSNGDQANVEPGRPRIPVPGGGYDDYDDGPFEAYPPQGSPAGRGHGRDDGRGDGRNAGWEHGYDDQDQPYAAASGAAGGAVPTGRATVGRATVPSAAGTAAVASAPVGRATVRPATGYTDDPDGDWSGSGSWSADPQGRDDYDARDHDARDRGAGDYDARDHDERDNDARDYDARDHDARDYGARELSRRDGTRSVPTGRASVGRAAVGTASVGRASIAYPDEFDDFGADSGGGPGGPGSRGGGPGGPGGPGRGGRPASAGRPKKKKRRRRSLILSAVAILIMLSGLAVVVGAYEFDNVPLPVDFSLKQSTTVYYSDGKTPMAKFGDQNRTMVALAQVSPWVPKAVVATEDNSFYSNSGISLRGIARAAWNNVSGGDTQGGSTISQQYMRQYYDATVSDRTVKVKIKEALGAIKLDKEYKKDQIMEMYLNIVYFGRGAYGIEAAAQAYFGKSSKDLTVGEAMVLAGVIKDPGGGAFDPMVEPQSAKDRWNNYIKPNMVKLKYLSQAEADALQYPTTVIKPDAKASTGEFGKDLATGLVVHHVMAELVNLKDPRNSAKPLLPDLAKGGYQIITTIDKAAEDAAINAASATVPTSQLRKLAKFPDKTQAALVAVNPATGGVTAYYGGDRGDGTDYAGFYVDPILGDPDTMVGGGHPPGSSFKIYTLAAALQQSISIHSWWIGKSPREFPVQGRVKGSPAGPIRNAGASCDVCQLWKGLQQSMNTVFFAVGAKVGAAKIIDIAHAMGINSMWANIDGQPLPKRIDFTKIQGDVGAAVSPTYFDNMVSIGQYPVTVLDHANGVATIAAGGIYRPAHFVQKVLRGSTVVYPGPKTAKVLNDTVHFNREMDADLSWSMQQVLATDAKNGDENLRLAGGREAAGKTGTWQYADSLSANAHAWFVGFTPQLAAAVWVGNKDKEEGVLTKTGNGQLCGACLPGPIWKAFMDGALKNAKKEKLPAAANMGDDGLGDLANSPSPSPSPGDPGQSPCLIPALCPTTPPGGGGGGGGGRTLPPVPKPSRSR